MDREESRQEEDGRIERGNIGWRGANGGEAAEVGRASNAHSRARVNVLTC